VILPAAISFGEVVIDCFPTQTLVAGSPFHVAAHLQALGWSALLVTRVGDDDDGRRVVELMREREMDTSLVEVDPELPTGRVTIRLTDLGHTFDIHRPAAWDRIDGPTQLLPHKVFCFGSLVGRSEHSLATLRRLLVNAGPFPVMDANLRPPDVVAEALRLGLENAVLVKLNSDEIDEMAAALGFPAEPREFFERGGRLQWLCTTRGADGAELFRRDGESWNLEGESVEVVDTVGAGDAFTAGLVDALARGRAEPDALAHAQSVATGVLTHTGGLPQTKTFARESDEERN
jgi:fructokinase